MGAAFTLRAVGDAGDGRLSWLSPLGWSLQVRPYAGDRWWVLLLHLVTTVALTLVAYRLLAGRDVGAGLIAERAGPGTAGTRLSGVHGLTWRLDRGALLLWTVGLCLYGLLMGSVVHGIGDELGDSTVARDIVARMGGTSAMEQAFIAVAFTMLGMVAAAFAISLTLRLHQEESGQRAETDAGRCGLPNPLAGKPSGGRARRVRRSRCWSAGVAGGLIYGVAAGDVGGKLAIVLGTAAVQLPAVWLLAAVTVALFGLAPRFTPVAWGVLVGVHRAVPDRFAGRVPAVAARPRTVRAHPAGRRRRLHRRAAAVAAGHRRGADHRWEPWLFDVVICVLRRES